MLLFKTYSNQNITSKRTNLGSYEKVQPKLHRSPLGDRNFLGEHAPKPPRISVANIIMKVDIFYS